jgi:hypothetical protein
MASMAFLEPVRLFEALQLVLEKSETPALLSVLLKFLHLLRLYASKLAQPEIRILGTRVEELILRDQFPMQLDAHLAAALTFLGDQRHALQ